MLPPFCLCVAKVGTVASPFKVVEVREYTQKGMAAYEMKILFKEVCSKG